MEQLIGSASHRDPWNKGKLVGQKAPLIIGRHVDEVLLVEASFRTAVGGQRLRHQRGDACNGQMFYE